MSTRYANVCSYPSPIMFRSHKAGLILLSPIGWDDWWLLHGGFWSAKPKWHQACRGNSKHVVRSFEWHLSFSHQTFTAEATPTQDRNSLRWDFPGITTSCLLDFFKPNSRKSDSAGYVPFQKLFSFLWIWVVSSSKQTPVVYCRLKNWGMGRSIWFSLRCSDALA